MVCAMCKQNITDAYYHLNGRPICASCKVKADAQIAQLMARGSNAGAMALAVVFGLGAAIAGAAIYYAVLAIAHVEIGIIAILIGYMVGWSIRKATAGVGGRQYQILAVALTYLAVCLAYTPLVLNQSPGFLDILGLPVRVVMGSGASGILTVIIVGVGLRQAWHMTGGVNIKVSGPYKIGAAPRTAAT
jgi:hypothetical protein